MIGQPSSDPGPSQPRIWAFGGGKGGVGKSLVCATIAETLARGGARVIAIDLDLGAANLHTLLGVHQPTRAVTGFLSGDDSELWRSATDTTTPGLQLISGAGAVLSSAHPRPADRARLAHALLDAPSDYVLIDLGAGTHYSALDFFNFAGVGLVVTAPEPTSIQNAYTFIKASLMRGVEQAIGQAPGVSERIARVLRDAIPSKRTVMSCLIDELASLDPSLAERAASLVVDSRARLVINSATPREEQRVLGALGVVCQRFLGLDLVHAGTLPQDSGLADSVRRLRALPTSGPFIDALEVLARGLVAATAAARPEMVGADERSGGVRSSEDDVRAGVLPSVEASGADRAGDVNWPEREVREPEILEPENPEPESPEPEIPEPEIPEREVPEPAIPEPENPEPETPEPEIPEPELPEPGVPEPVVPEPVVPEPVVREPEVPEPVVPEAWRPPGELEELTHVEEHLGRYDSMVDLDPVALAAAVREARKIAGLSDETDPEDAVIEGEARQGWGDVAPMMDPLQDLLQDPFSRASATASPPTLDRSRPTRISVPVAGPRQTIPMALAATLTQSVDEDVEQAFDDLFTDFDEAFADPNPADANPADANPADANPADPNPADRVSEPPEADPEPASEPPTPAPPVRSEGFDPWSPDENSISGEAREERLDARSLEMAAPAPLASDRWRRTGGLTALLSRLPERAPSEARFPVSIDPWLADVGHDADFGVESGAVATVALTPRAEMVDASGGPVAVETVDLGVEAAGFEVTVRRGGEVLERSRHAYSDLLTAGRSRGLSGALRERRDALHTAICRRYAAQGR